MNPEDALYNQALDYIYGFVDYEKQPRDAAYYDLRRVDEVLERLGNPHLAAKTVHIAGTKGKGSVAAMVASVLTHSGYVTGFYISPHLINFNERIQIDCKPISNEELVTLLDKVKPEVEAVNKRNAYGQLTTFEIMTALGFAYFKQRGVDFQVIEVGLGGRLDATNVVKSEVSVITSIGFDHTEVLGNTLTEIATEKAGIIKPNGIVVSSPQVDEAARVIEQICLKQKAKLVTVGRDVTWKRLEFNSERQSLQVKGRLDNYKLSIPLIGRHQLENAATAVAALEVLAEKGFKITRDSIEKGMERLSWPGRLQVLSRRPLLVVDGAHNPYSAQKLRQALGEYLDFEKAILIIGTSIDKDIAGIVSELAPIFNKVIVTHAVHPRATPNERIVAEFNKFGVETQAAEDVPAALRMALAQAGERDLICATGSLFVVGETIDQAKKLGLTA
ncbi:MAG: folylpolyglutamate synthase/dihydrofolate synthase family protein [Chloroflexota bacterium]